MISNQLPSAHLHRMTIDLKQKQAQDKMLNMQNIEFPRINENYTSRQHRFIYTAANTNIHTIAPEIFNALIKYDVITGTTWLHGSWMPGS